MDQCTHLQFYMSHSSWLTKLWQLKQTYIAIETYRNLSGVHWDHSSGAGICSNAEDIVWKEYLTQRVSLAFVFKFNM